MDIIVNGKSIQNFSNWEATGNLEVQNESVDFSFSMPSYAEAVALMNHPVLQVVDAAVVDQKSGMRMSRSFTATLNLINNEQCAGRAIQVSKASSRFVIPPLLPSPPAPSASAEGARETKPEAPVSVTHPAPAAQLIKDAGLGIETYTLNYCRKLFAQTTAKPLGGFFALPAASELARQSAASLLLEMRDYDKIDDMPLLCFTSQLSSRLIAYLAFGELESKYDHRTVTARTIEEIVARKYREIEELVLSKNVKYGNTALEPMRVFSRALTGEQILVRLDDKLGRLMRGIDAGDGESPIVDLLGYLLLLRVHLIGRTTEVTSQ